MFCYILYFKDYIYTRGRQCRTCIKARDMFYLPSFRKQPCISQQKTDTKISEVNMKKFFPGNFRTRVEQNEFQTRYMQAYAFNRTTVVPSVASKQVCEYSCNSYPSARKRRQTSRSLTHGCCQS